jgi:predicted metal-dependent hydrolase
VEVSRLNGQLAMPFEPIAPIESFESTQAIDPIQAIDPVQPIEPLTDGAPEEPSESTAKASESSSPTVDFSAAVVTHPSTVEGQEEETFEKPSALEVRIVRSARRKKSVGAQIIDGVVQVTVPMWMSRSEADRFAEQFRKRFEKSRASTSVDLEARAKALCRTYGLPKPLSIRWVTNQNSRWGSCTPTDSTIRINNRLAKVPTWVLDYVIVHEVCHLRHPNHSSEFWALVNTYPRTERARGFLLGMGMVEDGEPEESDSDS